MEHLRACLPGQPGYGNFGDKRPRCPSTPRRPLNSLGFLSLGTIELVYKRMGFHLYRSSGEKLLLSYIIFLKGYTAASYHSCNICSGTLVLLHTRSKHLQSHRNFRGYSLSNISTAGYCSVAVCLYFCTDAISAPRHSRTSVMARVFFILLASQTRRHRVEEDMFELTLRTSLEVLNKHRTCLLIVVDYSLSPFA